MLLSEDHRAVQDAVRAYVQDHIAPNAAAWDRSHHFPADELRGLAALGCYGVAVPTEWDGAGLDYLALAVILEEIAAGDGATSTVVSVNNCPVCSILMAWANDAQKAQWLKALARGDMLGAFCLTEPHVGSQADGLKTTAQLVKSGDGDHYVLNGVKQFITSGKNGDVAIVMAVTDKAAGKKGISAFIVPTNTPGYTVASLESKMGQHASDTAQVIFENCRVPLANLLGQEGQGLKIALSGLEGGRIGIASQSVGMARAAFEAALAYSKERIAFGQPIFQHQAVQFRLADMATQIEAARQLIHHAASLKDAGVPCLKEAAMAKLFASEMAERVCSAAIQVFGGYGYVSDFPVERIYRDVRVCQIYEGTSDVQKILIGRALASAPRGIKALVFDVFGTVVDWRGTIVREGAAISASVDWAAFADAWRAGYPVAMDRARRGEIAWTNIDALHRGILDEIRPRFGLDGLSEPQVQELNRVWHRLDPWPDTLRGLRRLKAHYVISTLSNGNVSLLVDMAKHARLPWDCVLSAELFQHYKPDPEVYQGAARLLDVAFDELLMVAAHPSDLRAAQRAGLRTAYIPRPLERGAGNAMEPVGDAVFDFTASDFEALADQLGA